MELIEAAERENLELVQHLLDGNLDRATSKRLQHLKIAQEPWPRSDEISSNMTSGIAFRSLWLAI